MSQTSAQRLAWLGNPPSADGELEIVALGGSQALLDFDLIIWNASSLAEEFVGKARPQPMNSAQLQTIEQALERRAAEVVDFLAQGRVFVTIADHPRSIVQPESGVESSGFERAFWRLLDVPAAQPYEGRRLAMAAAGGPFEGFVKRLGDDLLFRASLPLGESEAALIHEGTKICVGGFRRTPAGGLRLWLPGPRTSTAIPTFVTATRELVRGLRRTRERQALPAWTREYLLPDEARFAQRIADLDAKIKALYGERSALESELETLAVRKHLFAGDGPPLEEQIEWALTALGLTVERVSADGGQRIARWNNRPMVIDCRSYGETAGDSEPWARLQRRVSDFVQAHQERPKGLAVINASCETRLDGRKGAPWPEKLVANMRYDHYCLASGLQLLNMALTAIAEPSRKQGLAELLFATDGPIQGFDDWKMHLKANPRISPGEVIDMPKAAAG